MSNRFGPSTMPPGFGPDAELLSRATAALNGNRPDEAERLAAGLLKRKTHHAPAPHILRYALLMQGRARDAVTALEAVVRNRRDPELDTQLAIALRQAGRPDDAVTRLKRATNRR